MFASAELVTESKSSAGSTNTVAGYSIGDAIQTRNTGEIVTVSGVIDDTEGCGAMDTYPWVKSTRNLDIGGGQFDAATKHLFSFYGVKSSVYDPYNRSAEHNAAVLAEVKLNPVDTVTSNSVLNVILQESQRKEHIKLAYQALKNGGSAFFKVWRGNGTGTAGETQSNKEAIHYFGEICDVFGELNVSMPQDDIGNTIIARKTV